MTISPSVSLGGSLDADDKRAALLAVARENAVRLANNQSLLPIDTAANLRASYITVLSSVIVNIHTALINDSKTSQAVKDSGWTQPEIDTIHAAIVDRLAAGESKAAILADITA